VAHLVDSMADNNNIDVVYLWVDGNDPEWRAKRHRATRNLSASSRSDMAVYGNVEGRFRDNDELRYSLRALEKYFPDHGHVYIVTDNQTPAWLQPRPGLSVIDHRELIPPAHLPTFDSGNIESYIHRIPGLSERFFYFNDDVFFGAPVDVDDWFWPGGVYTAWSDDALVPDGPLQPEATSLENGCRLSARWLAENTGTAGRLPGYQHTPRTFAHAPRPMLKSLFTALEGHAPGLFAMVRSTRFRTWDKPTIVSDFVLRWALAHGVARLKDYAHRYVSTGDVDTALALQSLEVDVGELGFFCINDTTDDAHRHDPRLTQVRSALERMFGVSSKFEQAVPTLRSDWRSRQRHGVVNVQAFVETADEQ
jgi:Stealth protein CR2, conserved region 2/Stealth protein CR1, conserved region 1